MQAAAAAAVVSEKKHNKISTAGEPSGYVVVRRGGGGQLTHVFSNAGAFRASHKGHKQGQGARSHNIVNAKVNARPSNWNGLGNISHFA
jgi:hypothetical protein